MPAACLGLPGCLAAWYISVANPHFSSTTSPNYTQLDVLDTEFYSLPNAYQQVNNKSLHSQLQSNQCQLTRAKKHQVQTQPRLCHHHNSAQLLHASNTKHTKTQANQMQHTANGMIMQNKKQTKDTAPYCSHVVPHRSTK